MRKLISLIIVFLLSFNNVFANDNNKEMEKLDTIIFGNELSESEHNFSEVSSIAKIDDTFEPQTTVDNLHIGGGIGDGLSYRQMLIPKSNDIKPKLQFTLKADPTKQNYFTIRISGSQYGRGNIVFCDKDGDTTKFKPISGTEYSEIDCGFFEYSAPFDQRYAYLTYKVPQTLIKSDGTMTAALMLTGKLDAYGTAKYKDITQNSKYIYSAYTHTDPFFIPDDNFTGEKPVGKLAEPKTEISAYDYLKQNVSEMTDYIFSWQLYGEKWEKIKDKNNSFMEGAFIKDTPLENANLTGTSDEIARRYTLSAINHQNWSTMSNLQILANAYIYEFSGDKHNSDEVLDRYFSLLDFYVKAQDIEGGWCYYTKGEDTGKWLGADLNGSGERLKGENWPLLSLGLDAMMQSYIGLYNYVSKNEGLKAKFEDYLNKKIDGDLTAKFNRTRRDFYIDMFGAIRERLSYSNISDTHFYLPSSRAGTANQDFAFAYDANKILSFLYDTNEKIDASYKIKDQKPYIEMVKYKFSEMIDGQKWFSHQGLGLEGGASHGGWAGDYGSLLIGIANKYAENSHGVNDEAAEILRKTAYNAFETAKYFYYPGISKNGEINLMSELFGSSRNSGYGTKSAYPVGGYTAVELGSSGAMAILRKYIEDNRAYFETIKDDVLSKNVHTYTMMVDAQNYLLYYKKAEEMIKQGINQKPLPMEDEHEDFAWFDLDGQTAVFKNKGDKAYFTFNYRRANWQYNDNTRIHFITDKTDRLVDVKGTHSGGIKTYDDYTYLTPAGKPTLHNKYDGYIETKYGKYIVGLNQSEDKPYKANTLGVKKAYDLVSKKEYAGINGEDIEVTVNPRHGIILEITESTQVCQMSAKYVCGDEILGYENINAKINESITMSARFIEGYKLITDSEKTKIVSDNSMENVITFEYEKNDKPVFDSLIHESEPEDFKLLNYLNANGELSKDGDFYKISSLGTEKLGNLSKTFAYKELSGDFKIHVRLNNFSKTTTDQDYFSVFATDGLDLEYSNFFELRHFSNNNNILLVSHDAAGEKLTKNYWASDMNNKAVPIHFIVEKKGSVIEYWYSLDEGETYQQTSKPKIELPEMGNNAYVGIAMTATNSERFKNSAFISDISISGDMVGKPVNIGDEIIIDFKATDSDIITYEYDLPEDSLLLDENKVKFIPTKGGEYSFVVKAYDEYHKIPQIRSVKINVAPVIKILVDGAYLNTDTSPYLVDDMRVLVPLRAIAEKLGFDVSFSEDTKSVGISKGENVINLTIGSDIALVNGKEIKLDVSAQLTNNRTMVPVRFVLENLGVNVEWDNNTVIVTTGEK